MLFQLIRIVFSLHTHPSHYISELESYFSEESEFYTFVITMRSEYEPLLKEDDQNKFSVVSEQKTLAVTLEEV